MTKRRDSIQSKSRRSGSVATGSSEIGARQRILQVASRLFASHGYDGTTVKDIAREADINGALISYYFRNKEGLYKSCLREFGQQRMAVTRRLLSDVKSKEELRVRLHLFVQELLQCHMEEPDLCKMIQRECEAGFPLATDIFQETFLVVFKTLEKLLTEARKQGIIKKSVDPHVASTFIFGSVMHTVRMDDVAKKYFGRTLEKYETRNHWAGQLVDVAMGGLCGQKK